MTEPLVSIGIPTRNRRKYLSMAIESVMNQTYSNLQIIVSDNCSTDDTWEYLKDLVDPRLNLIRQEQNIGMVGNFNASLKAASGEYFLMLSDDDVLTPHTIQKLIGPLSEGVSETNPNEIGMVWCPCVIIDATGKPKWHTAPGPRLESPVQMLINLFNGNRGPRLSSVLLRTSDALLAGGYDQQRFGDLCDTGNWGQAMLRYSKVACVPEPLVKYRVHSSSGTGQAVCADWQSWGLNLHGAMVEVASRRFEDSEQRQLKNARKLVLANLTIDVLMRDMGNHGWLIRALHEFFRSRRFMLTPHVAKRIVKEGWKLLR